MNGSIAAFTAAMTAVLEAARGEDLEDLVARLRTADETFVSAVQAAGTEVVRAHLLQEAFPALRGESALLAKMDYASSLVSNERPFFRAAMELVAEQAQSLTREQLLSVVGVFRRAKGYTAMAAHAAELRRKLEGDDSAQAHGLMAKVLYEEHMAVYQQAEETQGDVAQALYEKSAVLAKWSASEADKAGDPCGRLFALMNVSGLLLPKMHEWEKALKLSIEVSDEAEALAAAAPDAEAAKRPQRVVMNCLFHRLEIGAGHSVSVQKMQSWLSRLEVNPVYQSCKEQDWAREAVAAARQYIDS